MVVTSVQIITTTEEDFKNNAGLSSSNHQVLSLFTSFYTLTSSCSFPIMCPYHLSLASLTFSAMSTTPHLLISSFHNVSDQLSFISSYYVSIPSQPCFPHLLCNVYHSTSSDLLFHNVSDQLSFISSYYVSIPSQPCFPHLLCNVYHSSFSNIFIP